MRKINREKQDKAKFRQQQICRGALKVLKRKKFHAASMREIAAAARMSIGNLYNYIDKKEDILIFIHENMFARIHECFERTFRDYHEPQEQLVAAITELFKTACQMKEEALIILTEARSLGKKNLRKVLQRESEVVGIIESIIVNGIKTGVFKLENPHLFANVIASNLWIIPLRGWNILPYHTEQEVLDYLLFCFFKVLKGAKP